ncbi:CNNM domain-containing protein [Nocardioides litoris]|uniref:CNNM domain-containing protein n=1 Tax=Nocardioides litoris TaxID=1926648 RepID=UPI00111DAA36|nr:hemolysin family protein [Nocardioides litoris]
MNSPVVVTLVTVALIALSAFFVAVEFAVLAARRHRLEERSAHSASARAAVRSSDELTVLLAGCQLGITACALGLGAVTKPAVNYALTPLVEGWGAPSWVADVTGFAIAIFVVTFLHLVIGEMAPKSWAIAHPETAAIALALPMRGFMWVFRPVLKVLNETANWCLRRVKVEPRDTKATGQTPADLRALVEHSANVGALDASFSSQVTDALDLETLTLGELADPTREITSVPLDATVIEVRDAARATGHLRILLHDTAGHLVGMVHVRDTMGVEDATRARDLRRDVLVRAPDVPAHEVLTAMRRTRTHLAVVTTGSGPAVVTLDDVVARLLPSEVVTG